MRDQPPSGQRSFRLSRRTLDLLDHEAEASGQSRNALADRLLGEALRVRHHPLIRFHEGAAGRRQPLVAGTRLYVHQIVASLRASRDRVAEVADYLGLSRQQVQAARDYYSDFKDEIDDDAATGARVERVERERWERQQRALA